MCYKALTCNVEILVWLYILIMWKRKISYSLICQKGKIYRYPWDVFLILWTLLSLGRDNTHPISLYFFLCKHHPFLYIYEVPFIYFVSLLYRFKFLALYCYDCVYLSLSSFMLIFICCWLWCCYVPRWVLNHHLYLTWVVPLGGRNLISSRHLGTFYVLVHIMSSLLFNAIPPSPLLLLSSILFNVSPPSPLL